MEKVNIEPCVKMDTQTLDLLKIRDDVTWYIRKLGLSKLFKLECSEYSQLTKEFLSTVALAFPNHNGDQPAGDGLLLFKIGDANGRISSQLYANSLDFPMRQHMTSRRTQRGNKLPLLIGHTLPMNHSCLQGQRCLESLIQPFAMCTASSPPLSNANKKPTSSRLGRQQEALCSFWEAYHGHSTHVGIDIPNYEPLPKPTPLDLHALQHIHFLNRWTKDPTRFCYEFPIGPANTSLVLLPHEDIPSLRSGVVTFQPNEEDFYVPSTCSQDSTPLQERHVLTTGMAAHQALDRVNKLEKIVECQSRFISRLVRVVRHIAPERLFRPSSTAREPYEPDLGEFSLDSELGSEGDDPIDEEESSSHCHT
ncbi:unnamed protein product [Microthlaspi erraticum]|uniref:Arabidopsis retrotransposon Orf1 C-terminal domain-containing protein n=1 Tax=Microthlaspi erraticum TaxID=1685480 RepID=A0A6D2IH39_9BRAS|nr:unnamed protein product [Microthlaspi erraticum]